MRAGTLKVEAATEGSGSGSGSGSESGSGSGSGGGSGSVNGNTGTDLSQGNNVDLNRPVGTIVTNKTGTVYLRVNSYGLYNGKGFDAATAYGYVLEDGYGLYYLTGTVLENSGAQQYTAEITPMNGFMGYALPYYVSKQSGGASQNSDVFFEGDLSNPYTVSCYDYTFLGTSSIPSGGLGGYTAAEAAYREFVYRADGQYLALPESTLQYVQTIIRENAWSLDDPMVVNKIAYYVQNAAT